MMFKVLTFFSSIQKKTPGLFYFHHEIELKFKIVNYLQVTRK